MGVMGNAVLFVVKDVNFMKPLELLLLSVSCWAWQNLEVS